MDNNRQTITVDGVEGPAQNSEGRPLHWSDEGTRNFWRWFYGKAEQGSNRRVLGENGVLLIKSGSAEDSGKDGASNHAVDVQGRLGVYYHGTKDNFSVLELGHILC